MAKFNQSMKIRFTGSRGKQRLIDCVCKQQIVEGDLFLAKELISKGTVVEKRKGTTINKQGDSDNHLYLIITGSVCALVNNREIGIRAANTHFGEMTIIDHTALRSATITARESCILLRINESDFASIASKKPKLWRNMAVTLCARLIEREKFLVPPHSEPTVFIGSSTEALRPAKAIYKYLSKKSVVPQLWTDGVFQVSKTAIEDLYMAAKDSDFAVIVLSPDDVCISRGMKRQMPRDNTVFELGLFTGAIGRDRTFILTPINIDIKIPTDLLGVTCIPYKRAGKGTIAHRLQPVFKKLWGVINKLGPK